MLKFKHAIIVVLAAIGCFCLAFAATSGRSGSERTDTLELTPEPHEIAFGVLTVDENQSRTAHLINKTTGPIRILKVATSCGCIGLRLEGESRIVPPGGRFPVVVEWHADKAQRGRHRYEVAVLHRRSDGTEDAAVFPVSYEYRPDYLIGANLLFVDARNGHGQGTVRLLDLTPDRGLRVTRLEASHPEIIVDSREENTEVGGSGSKTEQHEIVITARIPRGWPLGEVDEEILVETNSPTMPRARIPIRAVVQGPVRITPQVLLLNPGERNSGDTIDRIVWLRCDQGVKVGEVVSLDPGLNAAYEPSTPESGIVRIRGHLSEIPGKGTVQVRFVEPFEYMDTIIIR